MPLTSNCGNTISHTAAVPASPLPSALPPRPLPVPPPQEGEDQAEGAAGEASLLLSLAGRQRLVPGGVDGLLALVVEADGVHLADADMLVLGEGLGVGEH